MRLGTPGEPGKGSTHIEEQFLGTGFNECRRSKPLRMGFRVPVPSKVIRRVRAREPEAPATATPSADKPMAHRLRTAPARFSLRTEANAANGLILAAITINEVRRLAELPRAPRGSRRVLVPNSHSGSAAPRNLGPGPRLLAGGRVSVPLPPVEPADQLPAP